MAMKRGLPEKPMMRHDSHYVEELTKRSGRHIGSMLPLGMIEPNAGQPRTNLGNIEELAASIREKGVLEPILVRNVGPNKYQIISGERRYRAANLAGLDEIPAIELDVDDKETLEIALIENIQRKDLTPFEEAEGYRALSERYEYTHEEIAETVGKSRTVITESLSLLQMPPRVRDTVQALGITSKSVLLEVLKVGDEQEMLELLEEIARQGLNRDDLRRRLRRGRQSGSGTGRRRKPYVFKFRAPDKRYNLSLSFRQSEVERQDLIHALEEILQQLRQESAGA